MKLKTADVAMLGRYIAWLTSGDTGVSSGTIFEVLTGIQSHGGFPSVPHDNSDFGRCYRLLKRFPEFRPQMGKVARRYPTWRKLVENWIELERLYEADPRSELLWARIKQCTGETDRDSVRRIVAEHKAKAKAARVAAKSPSPSQSGV